MAVRHRLIDGEQASHSGKSFCVRLLEVPEVMRCIGWDDSCWHESTRCSTLEDLDNWCNVAGNSYSIWHYLPWWASLLATYGKFLHQAAPAPDVDDVVNAEIDVLAADSD